MKKRRLENQAPSTLPGKCIQVLDEAFLARAAQYLRFSGSVYESDILRLGITKRNILVANVTRPNIDEVHNSALPRFALTIDHLTKSVILMIRGTTDFFDVAVDLTVQEAPLKLKSVSDDIPLVTHKGMLDAAHAIIRACIVKMVEALKSHKGYDLVLTGHSLGGGVAVLSSLLIMDEKGNDYELIRKSCSGKIECFGFAPPPMFGIPLKSSTIEDFRPYENIHIFIHASDVIPRSSMRSVQKTFIEIELIDKIAGFGGMSRLKSLMQSELSPQDYELVGKALKDEDDLFTQKLMFSKMIHPSKIYWLVPRVSNCIEKNTTNLKEKSANELTSSQQDIDIEDIADIDINEDDDEEEENEDEVTDDIEIRAKTVKLELKRLETLADEKSYQLRDVNPYDFANEPLYVEDSFAQDHLLTAYELALLQATGEDN